MAAGGERPTRDELDAIDTALIERYRSLERDRRVLDRRLEELERSRDSISAPVYERIRDDYRSKVAALAEEAEPLAEEAGRQRAALAALVERARAVVEEARLEREEHEVRHRLGELDDAELATRLERADEALAGSRELLEQAEEVAAPLLAAAGDAEPEDEKPIATAVEARAATQRKRAADADDTLVDDLEETETDEPSEPASSPAGAASEPAAADTPPARAAKTTLLPAARLIATGGSLPEGTELRLEPLTPIGRASDSRIQLDEVAVSRHHAEISLEEAGFVLRDLGSQNGTYVNDEAIEERVLADGDRVFIGTSQFVFRLD